MVDFRKLLPLLEENADKLPDVFKSLVKKSPAIEGEVVGDLATRAGKKVLPDIETTASQKIAPLMIEQATQQAPEAAEQAAQTLGRTAPKQTFMEALTDLSPKQKALAGAGVLTAASAPLLMKSDDTEQKDPRDTTNFYSPEYSESESDDTEEPETEEHAVQYPEGKSASEYLALSKQNPYSLQTPEVQKVNETERKPSSIQNSIDAAREEDRQRNFLMGMLKAGQMAGSALAHTKADTSYADKMLENPNMAANQLKVNTDLKAEMEKQQQGELLKDPNSALFKLVSSQYKKAFGQELPQGVTPAQLKAMGFDIDQLQNAILRREQHEMDLKVKQATLQEKAQLKKDQEQKKDENAYAQWLVGQTKGRSGIVQNALTQVQRGESLNEMFNALPKKADGSIDFSTAKAAHKEELVKALDLMLSGGKSTISGTTELRHAYSTAYDELAKIRQKIAGDELPSLGQQKIFEQIYDLMQRETNVARLQAARNLDAGGSKAFTAVPSETKRLQIHQLTGITPEEQALMNEYKVGMPLMIQLKSKNIDPVQALEALKSGKKIEQIVGEKTTTINKGQVTQDPKIAAYAQQNGLSYDHAKNILESRGYRGQ